MNNTHTMNLFARYRKALTLRNRSICSFLFLFPTLFILPLLLFTKEIPIFVQLFFILLFIYQSALIVFLNVAQHKLVSQLSEHFVASGQLQTMSELAASVAHEVRNPLTVVRGFVQILSSEEGTRRSEHLEVILSELSRAELVINDYLSLAKNEPLNKELINAQDLISDVCSLMSSITNIKGIQLSFECKDNLVIKGDRAKLKQVFVNIIKNAVEAIECEAGTILITGFKEGENVVLHFEDNGIGMTEEQLKNIGQPFQTSKTNGNGLGVFITKQIIASHKGTISYTSRLHKGTITKVTFPTYEF